ncbi:heterokaryon incompatibility protein-domain-containing protein, partial [Apiosordaria backusii]
MSRWHKTSCTVPDVHVVLDADIPHCRACDTVPDLTQLSAAIAGFSPLPPLPPDEALDQVFLTWPPTVAYLGSCREKSSEQCSEDFKSAAQDHGAFTPSVIYKRPLQVDEFRLLRLPPTHDHNAPVHLDIEIYKDDEYPNYEATSYTWGGEDEDSTLCKPIFVGPYWDVTFQTRNCWSMLQTLRFRRGDRVLWVDAMCIDQANMKEREQQVTKMLRLYEAAVQVVVYLGPDVTQPLGPQMLCQKRRGLHELQAYEQITLLDLLKRKYFSRLWVVQELMLSRSAVMRVGITDYHIDERTGDRIQRLDRSWDWSRTSAPWLQHAARRHVKADPHKSGLLDLLISTASCQCSDPRDRVFGLLALDGDQEDQKISLDYSLSAQHVMMGVFTHCLVKHRDLRVFWGAAGIGHWSEYPSWVPPWK